MPIVTGVPVEILGAGLYFPSVVLNPVPVVYEDVAAGSLLTPNGLVLPG